MADVWYYAHDGKQIGPLTLSELRTKLSSISGAKSILVWSYNYSNWTAAGEVSQLAPYLDINNRRMLNLNTPPLSVLVDERQQTEPRNGTPKRRRDFTGSIVTLVLIAVAISGARYLVHLSRREPQLNLASKISGNDRKAFVEEGIKSCLKKQEGSPENRSLSLSRETLQKYCSCYVTLIADATTYEDLKNSSNVSSSFREKIATADATCGDRMRRSLLGGN